MRGNAAETERQKSSAARQVVRGWVAVVIGLGALGAPLLIGDWALPFVFALSPMGLFMIAVGVVAIVRGALRLDR